MKYLEDTGRRWADVAERPFLLRWLFPAFAVGVPGAFGIITGIQRHNAGVVIGFTIFLVLGLLFWKYVVIGMSRAYLRHHGHKRNWR